MALLFYECAKATDNLLRLALCGPCAAAGLRPTYPDDPWFSDPDGGTEMIFLVPRMELNYHPGDGEPPKLDLAWMEKHVTARGGSIRATIPGVLPQFWCARWNIIRKVSKESGKSLLLLQHHEKGPRMEKPDALGCAPLTQAQANSTGQLVLKVLPGHENAISDMMDALTDFKGRPISVVRESQPIREHAGENIEVDAVASTR
eukprot:scaffold748_cov251-Pinguiococcus_pyrenoidosus.AAC.53